MSLAHELHKDDDEVALWPIRKLIRWSVFFREKNKRDEARSKAQKREAEIDLRLKEGGSSGGRSGRRRR